MSIVKLKDKRSGTVYVYESESYWDKEKGQPRNTRKLIGKLDENGNIVPTGRSGRKKKETSNPAPDLKEVQELRKRLDDAEVAIKEKDLKITMLEKQKKEVESTLRKLLEKMS